MKLPPEYLGLKLTSRWRSHLESARLEAAHAQARVLSMCRLVGEMCAEMNTYISPKTKEGQPAACKYVVIQRPRFEESGLRRGRLSSIL